MTALLLAGVLLAGYGRVGLPPSGACTDPGYMAMDPDVGPMASYQFEVVIRRKDRVEIKRWVRTYPTVECCTKAWQPVRELLDWLPVIQPTTTVTECR